MVFSNPDSGDRLHSRPGAAPYPARRGQRKLEGADTDVARSHARQDRARQRSLAIDRLARDTAASALVVGIASACIASPINIFTQHRPEAARPSPLRENGVGPEPLSLNISAMSVAVDYLAQEQRPAVAKLRREAAELVAGVGLGQRHRALGVSLPAKIRAPCSESRASASSPNSSAKSRLSLTNAGRATCAASGHVEALELARIGIVEGEFSGGWVVWHMRHSDFLCDLKATLL